MRRRWVWFFIAIVLVFFAASLFQPDSRAVTANYDMTVRVVSSVGTVLDGVASAVTANYDKTIRIVDHNGLVIDSFGSNGLMNPVTVAQGGTNLTSGTSGGILGFTGATTIASSVALTANLPVIGGGAGATPTVGTVTGNTTKFATSTGALVNGHCGQWDVNANIIDSGGACGGGGGSGTVNAGTINQLTYYAATGTAVSGETTITLAQTHAYTMTQSTMAAMTNFGAL